MTPPLRDSPLNFVALVDQLADAVVVADGSGVIRLVNEAATRLFGVGTAELTGQDLLTLMPARFRPAHQSGFHRFMATGTGRLIGAGPIRVAALRGDGTEIPVELSLGMVGEPGDEDFVVVGTLRDVTERVELERQVDLSRYLRAAAEVASRLQQAEDVETAYAQVLPALCTHLDWDIAALWLAPPPGDRLVCADLWRVGPGPASTFEGATRSLSLEVGEGLPGLCWARAEPISADVRSLSLGRAEAAGDDGFRQALAFPLVGPSGVTGVVELFRYDATPVDPELVALLGSVGAQLGQFLGRMRVEHELRHRAALLASQLEASADGVLAISPEHRVLAVNRRFGELWGLPQQLVAVGDPTDAVLAECRSRVLDGAGVDAVTAAAGAAFRTVTADLRLRDGRVLESYAAPIVDADSTHLGVVWHLRDDTLRRAAEEQRADLVVRLEAARRSQEFLLRASDVLAGAPDYAETLERLAGIAVPTLGDLCLIDVLDENGRLRRMAARHADPARQPLVDELRDRYPPDPRGAHPSVAAIDSRTSRWSAEMTDEFLRATTRDERHYALVKQLEFTSYLTVPLVADKNVLGSVTIVSAGSGRRFGPPDLALAEELAGRVAQVVAKARRYDREHRMSHILQASLLPSALPEVPGLTIAVRYLPGTRDVDVGGDFYDVIPLASGEVAIMVGDVAGHDVTAAAAMGQLRSANRALIGHAGGPAGLIQLMHQSWDALGVDRIATVLYLGLRPDDGAVRMASAGHLPPLVLHDGSVTVLPVDTAGPLGAPATPAVDWTGTLPSGAVLLCYTDGLVEDRHQPIDAGLTRLVEAVEQAGTTDPGRLCDRVLAAMAGDDRGDDVALLVVRRDAG